MREVQLPFYLNNQVEKADLIILVDYEENFRGKYHCRYRLTSSIRGVGLDHLTFTSPELGQSPKSYFQEIFRFLNNAAQRGSIDENYVSERLTRIGTDLYNKFFCNEFKELYWRVIDRKIKTIQIVSNEAWIPWEIIRPYKKERKKSKFLCEKFEMTRWLAGTPSPDLICINPLEIVAVKSGLLSADGEVKKIKQAFSNKNMSAFEVTPPSFDNINSRLASTGLFGLHFICHGAFNSQNPDYSTIRLNNSQDLCPVDINDENLTFGEDCSIVFLNACETAMGGEALTGIGGWAEAFIGRAKIGSFVGSIWKSRDKSASKFSVFFYKKLLEGKTIAEATRSARMQIMTKQDPTWLSYSVYANPMAHLLCKYCREGMLLKENVS